MEKKQPRGGQSAAQSDQAQGQSDYTKPVAYDTEGRPLYLRPTEQQGWSPAFNPQSHGNHQYVHVRRPIAPEEVDIPEEIRQRYEESRRRHPRLNLSKGEYVISAVTRHPFGLFQIWAVALVFLFALAALMANFLADSNMSEEVMILSATGLGLVSFFIFAGALIATYIYNSNRFYLTNESVVQEIMIGIFNKHEQTVSLANIEDASFYKQGIFSYIFDFGIIRLSTEGDETTYRFSYVKNPKRQIAILNNAVEAFKNGRPVEPPNDDQPS
jgi:hypothetical protein